MAILTLSSVTVGCGHQIKSAIKPNGLVQTPPMGWNSWNTFGGDVSEGLVQQIADALVKTHMRDLGYQYVNIDDGWALPNRANGHLQPDPVKFPHGIKSLADYLHSRGLKFGIYGDRGIKTCVKNTPGSFGYEKVDASDFAAWGVDYLKYDNCNPSPFSNQQEEYRRMASAIAATGRPMVFSICAWEFKGWMPITGNLWRTTSDIKDDWNTIVDIIDINEKSAEYAGPGKWNDPDMLAIDCYGITDFQHGQKCDGMSELVGTKGLTEIESRSHFSMWAIMAAPLIAGNDIRNMPKFVMDILMNREVITIDQDPLGRQGVKVWDNSNGLCVYSKVLSGINTRAVALFNRTEKGEKITANWKDIGLSEGGATVRNLWNHSDLGDFTGGFTTYVGPHEVVLLKITGSKNQ